MATAIEVYQQAYQDYLNYITTGKWQVARYTINNREMVYRSPEELFKGLVALKRLADMESEDYVGRTIARSAYRR